MRRKKKVVNETDGESDENYCDDGESSEEDMNDDSEEESKVHVEENSLAVENRNSRVNEVMLF